LDWANVEMLEQLGADNIFIFGLRADEVRQLKSSGHNPWRWYTQNQEIHRIIDALTSPVFELGEPGVFEPIRRVLLDDGDNYLHLADLESYISVQQKISDTFLDSARWTSKAILNVARMSKFSSDRTIREYARDIWNIRSIRP